VKNRYHIEHFYDIGSSQIFIIRRPLKVHRMSHITELLVITAYLIVAIT